jgi:hypothetical protein
VYWPRVDALAEERDLCWLQQGGVYPAEERVSYARYLGLAEELQVAPPLLLRGADLTSARHPKTLTIMCDNLD